jgi:hypothetical protein
MTKHETAIHSILVNRFRHCLGRVGGGFGLRRMDDLSGLKGRLNEKEGKQWPRTAKENSTWEPRHSIWMSY